MSKLREVLERTLWVLGEITPAGHDPQRGNTEHDGDQCSRCMAEALHEQIESLLSVSKDWESMAIQYAREADEAARKYNELRATLKVHAESERFAPGVNDA